MTDTKKSVIRSCDFRSLQDIIDTFPVASLIINQNGLVIDCNQKTLDLFDTLNQNEIIGRSLVLLSPEKQKNGKDSGSEAELNIKRAFDTGFNSFIWEHITLKRNIFEGRITLNVIEYEGNKSLIAFITDITNKEKKEEFKALFKNNPYGLYKLNPDLTIADVNPAFLNLSGCKKEECIGKSLKVFRVINQDGPTIEDAIYKQSIMTGKLTVEFPVGIKFLEYSYIPVFNYEGKLIWIFNIFNDLTELREKINESNSLIEYNLSSIIMMDPTGKILSCNPSFEKLSHYSREKILSMKMEEFKILERDGCLFSDTFNTKKTGKGRIVVDFDWAVKILDFTYIPIFDVYNNVVRIVAMYTDVSEQVSDLEEIKAFIYENPHAIITMSPDLNFTDVNPAFTKIMGYNYEEAIRLKLTDIKVIERSGQSVKEAIQTKKPVKGSLVAETPAGIRHLDYVYVPVLDKKGTLIKLIELFSDHTAITSTLNYLNKSVDIIQKNINLLARGNTKFKTNILEADEYSASAREEFAKIGKALETASYSIFKLVTDSNAIAEAAIAGDMKFRSDPSSHEGEYRTIIEGMNRTLDNINIPIIESMRIAREFANYNFSERFDSKINIKGDWIKFRDALNNIGIQISDAISLINKNVSELAANTEEANASVEEIVAGAQLIATNTGRVSQNAEHGGDGISQILRAMDDLNATVGSVSRKAELVSIASNEANELAKGGINLALKSEKAMGEITMSAEEVDSIVSEINSQMNKIGKIVRLISDIANQTNLLALNAAIEAARAGEAGRGFAVVAAEVKSLAQDSRKSAENITDMIGNLQSKANQATEAMGKSTTAVMEGSNALNETLSSFKQIAENIENINQNTVDVASSSEEQAASVEEVTASIQEVSTLIQNTSREAGDTAAATEQTSASIDEIGKIMVGIVKIVEEITAEMTKFKVS